MHNTTHWGMMLVFELTGREGPMKRFALVIVLFGLMATRAAAQSGSGEFGRQGRDNSSHVILKGVTADAILPASATTVTPQQAEVNGNNGNDLARCGSCKHPWPECCCPTGCGVTIFAEWLYLQPRGADPVYAARALNCFDPPLATEQIDHGAYDSYRFGISKTIHDNCSEIALTYWIFEGQDEDHAASTVGADVIQPLLFHPLLVNCPNASSTRARAIAGIDFDRINIDYKSRFEHNCLQLDWLVGFGYGQLEQDLTARYDEGSVRADSDLYGYGFRIGGGATYGKSWLTAYLHGDFTLLAANMNARYRNKDTFDGQQVDYSQDLDRLVPVLDLELGLAANVSCHTTLKVGYLYSIWWNVVTNQSFIHDVQHGDITGNSSDVLTFDGVFARIEFNF